MIIYLHGFNSTGDSAKGRALQAALANEITVYTPTYPYDPQEAIDGLTRYIQDKITAQPDDEKLVIIGSSLGGFYAQYLGRQFPGARVILINPALGPVETLQEFLGENTNYYTGEKYILKQHHLDALEKYDIPLPCRDAIPTLLLVDKADEVIDYRHALNKYQECGQLVLYEEGDHQFQHLPESIPEIKNFYFNES